MNASKRESHLPALARGTLHTAAVSILTNIGRYDRANAIHHGLNDIPLHHRT